MRRIVRAFLVWVMVIAMPLQGMAASTMLLCGASHERMMHALVVDRSATAAGHGHDHAHGGPTEPRASPRAEADAAQGFAPHQGQVSCSACAACCSVLALPASFALSEASSPEHPVHAAPVAPVTSHQPDGLDRPPRTCLG